MKTNPTILFILILLATSHTVLAQAQGFGEVFMKETSLLFIAGMSLFLIISLLYVVYLILQIKKVSKLGFEKNVAEDKARFITYLKDIDQQQADLLIRVRKKAKAGKPSMRLLSKASVFLGVLFLSAPVYAQPPAWDGLMSQPGIIITLVLIFIPFIIALMLLIAKAKKAVSSLKKDSVQKEGEALADYLMNLDEQELETIVAKSRAIQDFSLSNKELSGNIKPEYPKGLITFARETHEIAFIPAKKKASKRPAIDSALSRLIIWFLGTATFWLLFGTSVGEYLGIKFVAPDADTVSWLSFGRLRPVHTNAVFWGWASLAMLGLGYYVVPTVSNTPISSIKKGWFSLLLINASVLIGSLCLMGGINNGGGEYREYIWPVMALFGGGLFLTLVNFLKTVAHRKMSEIYISNWYIISAIIFTLLIAFVAYWPSWQNGLGETIVQGYYMHQGVGMWFMLFNLGLVYYFLPQQLNKPIYSYSLGMLAFWTQILFYTVIGTHHFVFSSIPWWLQTVAIVGSVGMLIPVAAGTTNFMMTFKGMWHKVANSYTLPFYLVGIVFYFTGSLQGTAEAFRYTNLIWHFTDFTVAHSHLTMYGIITFLLWANIYAILPRLTGKEAPQATIGIHFWMAFLGLMFYTVPLMIGGTLKGLSWMEGAPFIETVIMMAPYWLWRAIGGTMMWLSHLFFAYNFYKMVNKEKSPDVKAIAFGKLQGMAINEQLVASL